ncbi:hypothetical protein YE105_C0276 [Yersinia enterocolitica subsp. palearctica 105.5R(r)]|nr:hypothetical protein YE105_C0276 [Yersinia enterocolitica subsp. palearctica 105.5R(r)]
MARALMLTRRRIDLRKPIINQKSVLQKMGVTIDFYAPT